MELELDLDSGLEESNNQCLLDDTLEESNVLDEEQESDLIETIMQLMYEYTEENPTAIAEPDFEERLKESIKEIMLQACPYQSEESQEDWLDDIDATFEIASHLFHLHCFPPRSYPDTFAKKVTHLETVKQRIQWLKSKPQPQQRTPEWYEFRHNLITASNAYKAFESPSVQNNLIYEKCLPCKTADSNQSVFVSVDSTLHWGQKYEPVSVLYYEHTYETKVGDYGCIQHEKYPFLGASPDGINDDPEKAGRFGRMLEIKNIVNREIDGIPKKEYWIQMQLQMETCDLDDCDFLETRFTEYECEADFLADANANADTDSDVSDEEPDFCKTVNDQWKGIIVYFVSHEGKPVYRYKPLTMGKEEFESWYEQIFVELKDLTWVKNIYWKLEEVSCVLVSRNKKWFQQNIGQLQKIWSMIEKERVTGYEHRAPVRRSLKQKVDENALVGSGCLIVIKKMDS